MNRLKKESAFNRCNPQIPRSYYPFPHSRMLPHNPHADHHHAVGSFSCSGDIAHGSDPHSLGVEDTVLADMVLAGMVSVDTVLVDMVLADTVSVDMDDDFRSRSPENFHCFHNHSHCCDDYSHSCCDFLRIPDDRC